MLILIIRNISMLIINIEIAAELLRSYKFKLKSFIAVKLDFFLVVKLLYKFCNCNLFS